MLRLAAAAALALTLGGCAGKRATGVAGPSTRSRLEFSPAHSNRHNAIVRVITTRRVVALTFDDGPDPRYTPAILRILRRAGAHATFFVIGSAALRHPELVRAELRAGDEVGDHTFDHPRLPLLSARAIRRELSAGARAIERAGAPPPAYSRPPYGFFDERVGAIAAGQGRPLVGWDLVLEAVLHGHAQRAAIRALAARARPGSILLAHDGRLPRGRTVRALPRLLAALHARGLRVVTVGELLRLAGARA